MPKRKPETAQQKLDLVVLGLRYHGDEQCTDKQLIEELRAILADDIKKARSKK